MQLRPKEWGYYRNREWKAENGNGRVYYLLGPI